jgi:hypothetical protein
VPVPAGAAAAVHRYRLLGTVFEVRFPERALAERVDPVLRHLAADAHSTDVVVDVVQRPHGFDIAVDGIIADEATTAGLAPQVKSILLTTAVNRHGFAAYLHSAVLRHDGSLLLLPGAAGSGKTSLCLALCREGFSYHSDEAAILSPGTFRVRGAPISACVKDGAWPILEPLYPQLAGLSVHHRIDDKVVKYLPPPVAPGDPALDLDWPVRWLIFPRFAKGAETAIRPIRRAEALRRLLQECNAWQMELTAETVERMIEWSSGIDCYELEFSSLDEATRLVAATCRAGGSVPTAISGRAG